MARASLQELLLDYKDYLRVRNLEQWNVNSEKAFDVVEFVRNRMILHITELPFKNATIRP